MSLDLRREWGALLPGQEELGDELLARWSEPHRRYHDTTHLAAALDALFDVGGHARVERLAVWFHDAVHTGQPGTDERASAALAEDRLLTVGLPRPQIAEVTRLVLVTVHHSPGPADAAGARVSDADLAVLGSDPAAYAASVIALRAESWSVADPEWRTARLARIVELQAADPLFHTVIGRRLWSANALANLAAEQRDLLAAT